MAKWITTRKAFIAAAMSVAMQAQVAASNPVNSPDLAEYMVFGDGVEARLDADFTGDGKPDVACVISNEDTRRMLVLAHYTVAGVTGHPAHDKLKPVDSLQLEFSPLGSASLSLKNGVLLVDDLTGGTTATATTYRYRWDPASKHMRLIGLDAERYSRTNSHDSLKISWNLLTGAFETVRGVLNEHPKSDDDGAYFMQKPERTVRKSLPVYMEDTPNPDDLIDAEVPPVDEDRD